MHLRLVYATARALLERAWTRQTRIRLLGVGLSNLITGDDQLALPFARDERPPVGRALDQVRERFGYEAIRLGALPREGRGWLA